jgi:hypothetical protein
MERDALLPTVSHILACLAGFVKRTSSKGQTKRSFIFFQIFWITARSSVRSVEKRWVTSLLSSEMATVDGSCLEPKFPAQILESSYLFKIISSSGGSSLDTSLRHDG